ncbi:MAG: putative membrane protein required for colicin V production [Candidatus Omnitrophota bacterium]|jgi:uncharacterized membrane protein required for colicin V production
MKEYISSLSWLDYVILFSLIRGAFIGYRDGFFQELLRMFLYIVTLAVLTAFSGEFANIVTDKTFLGEGTATLLVIIAMALITYLVLKIILDFVLRTSELQNNFALKIVGLFGGMVRWSGLISLSLWTTQKYPQLPIDILAGSEWAEYFVPIAPTLVEFATNVIPEIGLPI